MKLGLKKLHISILFTIMLLLSLQRLVFGQELVPANVQDSRFYFKAGSNVFAGDTTKVYIYSHIYLCVEKCYITPIGAAGGSLTIRLKICNITNFTLQNVKLKLRKADIGICCGTTSFSLTSPTEAVVDYGNIAAGACGSSTKEFSFAVSNLSGSEPVCLVFTVYYGNYDYTICHDTVISAPVVSKRPSGVFGRVIEPIFTTLNTVAIGWLLYDKFKK